MQGPGTTEPDPRSSGINLADGRPREESEASNLQLLRRVILGLIQSISDGAELIGATIGEEISRARLEIEHRLIIILLMSAGIVLFSAGVLLLFQELHRSLVFDTAHRWFGLHHRGPLAVSSLETNG